MRAEVHDFGERGVTRRQFVLGLFGVGAGLLGLKQATDGASMGESELERQWITPQEFMEAVEMYDPNTPAVRGFPHLPHLGSQGLTPVFRVVDVDLDLDGSVTLRLIEP